MAFGLPVEGDEGPFAGDVLAEVATCGPDEMVEDVLGRLAGDGTEQAVVVNDHGVVLGLLQGATSEPAPDETVAMVMTLSPTTVRPSVLSSSLADADAPVLVTNSEGKLMGAVEPRSPGQAETDPELEELQSSFLEVAHAVADHFGDEDPSEEQLRSFLHDRLVAEGRTSEEADAYLAEMDQSSEDEGR